MNNIFILKNIMNSKKILIINTGGTISSQKTAKGFAPKQGHLAATLPKILGLSHPEMPCYHIHEYNPLLDSSNMTLEQWNLIAEDIAKNYHIYDGFVVLHGTDTMAYTASALSFMLENLAKPVILTGSQIPLSEARNDAVDNLVTSLWICAHTKIKEVCIYFDNQLLRGNRARKVSAESMSAFASPNYPKLADIGIHIHVHQEYCLSPASEPFFLQKLSSHFIANFRLFPGFSSEVLGFILEQPVKGLVLETFGAGNAQSNHPGFLKMLKQASDKGVVMINCTQCLHGKVEMSQYETGFHLQDAGLVSGYDMTPEAAHCKLLYLLSKYQDTAKIKQLVTVNLRGEMSL
jgi:L-asparaginase